MEHVRREPWTPLLIANGLGICVLWLVLLMVQDHHSPRNLGPEPSPWECLNEYDVSINNLFVGCLTTYQRWELSVLSASTLVLLPLLIRSLWKRRSSGLRPSFRLRTAMFAIAMLASEYATMTGAWDLKAKWNRCIFIEAYYEEQLPDEFRGHPAEAQGYHDHVAANRRRVRRPWELLWTSWDDIDKDLVLVIRLIDQPIGGSKKTRESSSRLDR